MRYQYEVIVERDETGAFVARCPSLPGCVSQGDTPANAVASLKEVITAYVKSHTKQEAVKCDVGGCEAEPMFHFTRIESRRVVFQKCMCDTHARVFFADFRSTVSIGGGVPHVMASAVCVDLEMLAYRIGREDASVCIHVHEVGAKRRLCILTDGWASWALMAQIKRQTAPRPLTHAAWAETIRELGGALQDVMLDRTSEAEDWWSANLRFVKDGRLATVDVRASDGLTLAVIYGVPIFVVETAMERFADRGEGGSGH